MKFKELWRIFWKWYNTDPEEKEEEKEFLEFSEKINKRISDSNIGGGWANQNQRVQTAFMIQNSIAQKKMVEANKNLHLATVALVIATGVLAYTSIMSSPNPNQIIVDLKSFGSLTLLVIILLVIIGICLKIIEFIFKIITKIIKAKIK
jgi:hypothetical protein